MRIRNNAAPVVRQERRVENHPPTAIGAIYPFMVAHPPRKGKEKMICSKCKAELPDGAIYCYLCGKKQAAAQRKHRKRANGTGTIYKMPGNRSKPYAAKRNNIFLGAYKTYSEAQKALERVTDADISDKYNMTFSQVYAVWMPIHAREVSASQMGCYTSAYKHCAELYDLKFRGLRKSDFQSVILKMEEAGKSKSTCEKVMQLFGQLSKWAMDECIVNQNHAQNVTTTASQKADRKPFTAADILAMQQSENPAAQIALILIATGARPNELFSVPLVNCYEDYFIGGSKTEAGKNRVIPVCPVGIDAYRRLRQRAISNRCQYLIDAYNGNRTVSNYTKRDFKSLMKEIGLTGMTTYNCRHTFITMAVSSGVTQGQLMQIVGHVGKETTKKYTHLDAPALVSAVSKIRASSGPDRADNLQVTDA